MATDLTQVQKKLWDTADELRNNSALQAGIERSAAQQMAVDTLGR